jgi:hypothetical protein
MTLEEIKLLEHIEVIENEYNIIIIPEPFYYVEVEDIPVNQIHYDVFEMLKQSEYSQIWVKCFALDACIDAPDASIVDSSIVDSSL